MEEIVHIDSIDAYNRIVGLETRHPLVTVVDLADTDGRHRNGPMTYNYGLYAVWLKQTYCGDITYGRQPYDYQEGTVTCFAPGQVVNIKPLEGVQPDAIGLLFHPDLIRGTSLAADIRRYSFFSYSSREALHLSEDERDIFKDCLSKINRELNRPIDKHSRRIICRNIELLLDYCMRFYERQFITRQAANHDVLVKFEAELDRIFRTNEPLLNGLPGVKHFADVCCLSPNYFGDLVKKETGRSPHEYIQDKIIGLAKDRLASTDESIKQIAYRLGFQYSQHFNRYFKRHVGKTPSEYRKEVV